MKQLDFLKGFLCLMVSLLLLGCQKLSDEEEIAIEQAGTLNVKARSAERVEIVYPVYLYAFKEAGECVMSQKIEEEGDEMELYLTAGTYRIVAVSGISDDYVLPDKPDLDSEILLDAETGADSPLMVGKADVTIGSESKATLEITMTYAVAAVSVSLSNVPEEVKSVSMFLSPFYTALSMDGEYGGDKESLEMVCSLNSENVWCAETRYVFPGSAAETVFSVVMENEDGTQTTYGYTWKGAMKANHPFLVSGNYSGGITVGGSLIVKGWETVTEVEFDFGTAGVAGEDENENEKPDTDLSSLPEKGEIWNGAIVADVGEPDDSGVEILLLTLDEWDATVAEIPDLLESYQLNNLTNWRLPDYEEAKMLRSRFSDDNLLELNERIADYDKSLYGVDNKERYLCDKSGVFYSFVFSNGTSITQAGAKRTYYVRLVKRCMLKVDRDMEY